LTDSPSPASTTHTSQCPVCGGPIHAWKTVNKGAGDYHFDRCTVCGYCFVNPRPCREVLAEAYAVQGHGHETMRKASDGLAAVLDRERAHPNSTLDARRIIASASQFLGADGRRRFLDVGCGYGFFSREALDRGFSVVPLEMASTERAIAAELLGLEPVPASFENYECRSGEFDVVLMSHVLEHVYDVNEWIEKAAKLLRPNGVCVVALPNFGSIIRRMLGSGDPFICPPMHLNHFDSRNLSRLMARHGFVVRKVEWASRIPTTAFSRRLPSLLRPAAALAGGLTSAGLSVCDALGIGMTTTVYAVRQ